MAESRSSRWLAGQRDYHVTAAVDSVFPTVPWRSRLWPLRPSRLASDPLHATVSTQSPTPPSTPRLSDRSISHGPELPPVTTSRTAPSSRDGCSRGEPDAWRKAPLPAVPPRRRASISTAQGLRVFSPHVRPVGCAAPRQIHRKTALAGVGGHGSHTAWGASSSAPRRESSLD